MASLPGCAAHRTTTQPQPARATNQSISSNDLILAAADREALYTLAGGLKPMSSGFWTTTFRIDQPDLDEVQAVNLALAPLRNDIWYAALQVFARARDGERFVHAYVVHRGSFAAMIDRYPSFWQQWGITPATHPAGVIAVVDRMPAADRWRGYGYMFGYPKDAIDFFVKAGFAARDGGEVGPGIDREFIQIPTHSSATGRFTYAVPIGHTPTADDQRIATQAANILREYSARRDRMTDVERSLNELHKLNNLFKHNGAAAFVPRP
ncbi:MAG: hypothetical protein AAF747_11305 [Planctomycetota bacterium]